MRETVLQGQAFANKELKRQRKDGTLLDVSLSVAPLRDAEGSITGVLAVYADDTERKRLEAQLLQSQKLESVGRLAGGVAHDFNNLLTVINCYGDLLLQQVQDRPSLRQGLEEIRKAGTQAASLTRQLLAFSRRQVLQPKVFSVNDVIEDMRDMLQRIIGEDIELEIKLDDTVATIKADPGQLQQVVMNLVVNARDAMPNGGKLTISTLGCDAPEQQTAVYEESAGRHVMLAVSDTGTGMDEETQRRVFEPFFTTKAAGTGTGLGLSTVWGIVKQSGGHITFSSQQGKGTTFRIYLPCTEEPERQRSMPAAGASVGGTETLLLVEDQPQLRLLTSRILSGYGYKVLEAADGMEALRICEQNDGLIQLVLTDVVMPGVTGIELGKRLKELNPVLKIVYMSGYTDDVILRQGTLEPGAAYLEKPFTPEGLAGKVREVLSAPTSISEK
jgi:signal transduction histidine kinase